MKSLGTTLRNCPYCGKEYSAKVARLKFGRNTTCSKECSYHYRKLKLPHTEKVSKKKTAIIIDLVCPICGKHFQRAKPAVDSRKYVSTCSRKCSGTAMKLKIIPRPLKKGNEFDCKQCGKHVILTNKNERYHNDRKFCSRECFWKWNHKENHIHWRNGYERDYGRTWTRQKNAARKRDNYTCQKCGITETEYGKRLDVHHIIRFANFDDSAEANYLSNLISLCNSCHTKQEYEDNPDRYKYTP